MPFVFFSVIARLFFYATFIFGCFLVYFYFLYHFVYKRKKPKYPLVPPEGRMDAYFPRTNIPRPIYEDMQRYPEFFGRKKKKFYRTKKVKRKS
jgi:hypothetical protein